MTQAREAKKKTADPLERWKPEEHHPNETNRQHSLLHLQRAAGNRAVVQLLESHGQLQTKLRISGLGDEHEHQADRAAEQVLRFVSASTGVVQPKCSACSPAATCAECAEEEETVQRKTKSAPGYSSTGPVMQRKAKNASVLSSTAPHIQRAPNNGESTDPITSDAALEPKAVASAAGPLIVEDDAASVGPGQMRKSDFLEQLRSTVCTTADEALKEAGQSTEGCPYIEKWLDYYSGQEPAHIERALRKYAPEAASATSARDIIPAVSNRVRVAVDRWARTGEITGIPPEMAGMLPSAGGALGAVAGMIGGAVAGIGSAIGGAVSAAAGAVGSAFSSIGSALFKRKEGNAGPGTGATHDADDIQQRLSGGQSLDGGLSSRMGAAFGHDFSGVRVHTDNTATSLSDSLSARAFTVGSDIAFGAGEYKPGTLIGDALIAHELAHVVQQGGGSGSTPMQKGEAESSSLEEEADESAVGVVASLWGDKVAALRHFGHAAMPRLKSGLRLQSCGPEPAPKTPYEKLVVEGTKKLQDPPFKFGLPWEGVQCGQVDTDKGRKPFDEEFWKTEVAGEKECMLVNKGLPSAAIDALFDPARRSRWQIDCTIFTQLPHLYALLKTEGAAKFNERVNNRIELRREFSTRLKTRTYWVEGSQRGWLAEAIVRPDTEQGPVTEPVPGSSLMTAKLNPNAKERLVDEVLAEAPVGSRVTFATYAIPTHFSPTKPVMDNTIKMGDNYYAAHDVPEGKDGMYTKEKIQELLAEKYQRPEQNVRVVLVDMRALP